MKSGKFINNKKLIKTSLFLAILLPIFSFLWLPADVQAADDYCIWRTASQQKNPCDAPGTNTDYWVIDSTKASCLGSPDPGENICCCQIKTLPGQCSSSKDCAGGQSCINNWCQNPSGAKTPKFTIPDFQVKIPAVKLSTASCVSDGSDGYSCLVPWLGEYIKGLYQYGLSIAGIIAAIVLMAGGLLWLVSGGDASKITQAKDLIVGSITGLVILATSYVILLQVNPDLVSFAPIKIGYINPLELPEGDRETDKKGAVNRSTTNYIIIHTAAGLSSRDEVDKYHKSKGWSGIGYNFYIERSGSFVNGRGENVVGAHSLKYNRNSIGISYSGCSKESQWNNKTLADAIKNGTITQAQLDTLVAKIKFYQNKYKIPRANVLGHYEEPVSKACPCLPMDELRKLINP